MPLRREVLHRHMLQDGLTTRGSFKVNFGSINLHVQPEEARLPEFSRREIGSITLIIVEGEERSRMNPISQFILEGFMSMLPAMAGDQNIIAEIEEMMMAEGEEVVDMNCSILKDIWNVMTR